VYFQAESDMSPIISNLLSVYHNGASIPGNNVHNGGQILSKKYQLGGVGHCFAWHVRVNPVFGFNFKTEELMHNEWAACNIYHQPHIFVWQN